MADAKPTIAVIGGTGALGSGLARRWARAGYPIVIGSRSPENAAAKAEELAAQVTSGSVRGFENGDAAAAADVVVLTVPFATHQVMLEAIKDGAQGKIMVDATVPLIPPASM